MSIENPPGKRLITPQDLYNFRFVHSPRISPDGREVLFVLSQVKNDDEYTGAIWKHAVETGENSCLVDCGYRTMSPRWSPSAEKFLYLVSNGPELQLWVCDSSGYDRRMITSVSNRKIVDPKWSRDGRYIYFLSDDSQEPGGSHAEKQSDVRVITRRFYRFDGEGYQHDRFMHVLRVDARGIERAVQVTSGSYDVVAYDLSPEGSSVAFVTNMDPDADLQNNADIYTVSTTEKKPRKIYASRGPISSVSYSPDGKHLAFIGNDYRFKFNTPEEVWALDLSSGEVSNLSHDLDRPARNAVGSDVSMDGWDASPAWIGNDQVLFLATDRGRANIYAAKLGEHAKVSSVTRGDQVVTSLSAAGDVITFIRMDSVHLPELYIVQSGQEKEKQATNFNGELLSRLVLNKPREFTFKARDGVEVHGFFTEPTTRAGSGPPACIVQIHGGGGAEGFQFMHEFHSQGAQGFAVLTCNFRGTQGYGEEYMRVLTAHYMEKDYSDIIDMVEHALKEKWIDPGRVGVTGGSYGGYLTNWAISHDGSLFKAAVTDRSVVNLYSFYGTSDDYRLIEEDVQVSFPWDRPEHFLSKSPIAHTKNVSTPLLIIHSEQDYRCPLEQAEQLYAFLKRQGKEVVLVVFPGENHGLSRGGKPHHRIERLLFNLWWFTSHIDAGGKVDPPVSVTGKASSLPE